MRIDPKEDGKARRTRKEPAPPRRAQLPPGCGPIARHASRRSGGRGAPTTRRSYWPCSPPNPAFWRSRPTSSGFATLAEDVVLVTYFSRTTDEAGSRAALRSSIWKQDGSGCAEGALRPGTPTDIPWIESQLQMLSSRQTRQSAKNNSTDSAARKMITCTPSCLREQARHQAVPPDDGIEAITFFELGAQVGVLGLQAPLFNRGVQCVQQFVDLKGFGDEIRRAALDRFDRMFDGPISRHDDRDDIRVSARVRH